MILEAFKLTPHPPPLVPCSPRRDWMDAFPDRHAYRCLPLTIANTHGWDILAPAAFEVQWNGHPSKADLKVRGADGFAVSNFTMGVVTLHPGYLFRTPPGWNLLVTGPLNKFKNGASPMTGIIESDWLPYPFTMNWQMTAPGIVRFEEGEPVCTVMPIPASYIEQWNVAIHVMSDDQKLAEDHEKFRASREANPMVWQRHYFRGQMPDGTPAERHAQKERAKTPVDLTGTRPRLAK